MKLIRLVLLIALLASGLAAPLSVSAAAAPSTPPPDPLASVAAGDVCVAIPIFPGLKTSADCPTGIIPHDQPGGPIIFYLTEVLKLMNILVGSVIVLIIVLGGVQYILSAGDPTNVKAAKKRITNAITALVLYLLMSAILNFLIPGGIL